MLNENNGIRTVIDSINVQRASEPLKEKETCLLSLISFSITHLGYKSKDISVSE